MCHKLLLHLQINTPITPLVILNLVISAQLKMSLCLQKIVQSSANHIYEVELFPVALISKCHPAHVVFHNGKVILINVKTMTACKEIFSLLLSYLNECHFVKMQRLQCHKQQLFILTFDKSIQHASHSH